MDDFVYPLHELLLCLFSLWCKADALMTVIAAVHCDKSCKIAHNGDCHRERDQNLALEALRPHLVRLDLSVPRVGHPLVSQLPCSRTGHTDNIGVAPIR